MKFSLKCDIKKPGPGSAKFLSKVIDLYIWEKAHGSHLVHKIKSV